MSDAARKLSQFTTVKDIDAYDPNAEGYLSADSLNKYAKARDAKKLDIYTTEADAVMPGFTDQYNNITGGGARFYSDPESRAELMKNGLVIPNGGNPVTASRLADFANRGQLEQQYMGGNYAEMAANPRAKEQNQAIGEARQLEKGELDRATEARNLADFAQAQEIAGSYLQPNQSRQGLGQFASASDIRGDVWSDINSRGITMKPEAAKGLNDFLDKAISDKWIPETVTRRGKTYVQGQINPYTGERKDKQVGTEQTIKINTGDGNAKDTPKIFIQQPPGGGTPEKYNWNNPTHRKLYKQREAQGWMDITA
jgi:hypothetical protein